MTKRRKPTREMWATRTALLYLIGLAYADGAITVADGMALAATVARIVYGPDAVSRGGLIGQRAFNRR
jgi:hypothetical protein